MLISVLLEEMEGWAYFVEAEYMERMEKQGKLFLRRKGEVGREIRVMKGENKEMDMAIWELLGGSTKLADQVDGVH